MEHAYGDLPLGFQNLLTPEKAANAHLSSLTPISYVSHNTIYQEGIQVKSILDKSVKISIYE